MKAHNRSLKIKIDKHSFTKQDLENLEQWENEGGFTSEKSNDAAMVKLPVKPGEVFEVVKGDVIVENGELYYEVELNLLALPQ